MGDELQIVMTCNASTLDEARRKVEQFVALIGLEDWGQLRPDVWGS